MPSVEPALFVSTGAPGAAVGLGSAQRELQCRHCQLPVPPSMVAKERESQFCCSGCRTVFAMLQEHNLGDFYRHRGDALPERGQATARDYGQFDSAEFLARYAQQRDDTSEIELLLEGVHCSACVWLVEKLPELLPGVSHARLNYSERLVRISWQPGVVRASKIARTLDRLGYPPHPHRPGARSQILAREQRNLLLRLGVAGASAGNSMLLALALYSGSFGGIEPEYEQYFRALSVLVALPAITWSAQVFWRGAWVALRTRTPHMDVPVSLGIVAASIWGGINVVRGHGDIYFDSVTALIFLLLMGRYTLLVQLRRAESSAVAVHALTPHSARLIQPNGETSEVPAQSVQRGDKVEVLAGDLFPVDGMVSQGSSRVETAWLTGESQPLALGPGDSVCAGTTNLSSTVIVTATRTGSETRAARLLVEVKKAACRRAPITELADRLSAYFLLAVVGLAGLAFALWLPSGVEIALGTAVSLLIVTCPCALGLATPLAMSAALHQAARSGWLIKGGAFVEALAQPALVVFDKTGTLTTGHLRLVNWTGDRSLQGAVKALEANSRHPVARALMDGLPDGNETGVGDVIHQLGCGVRGVLGGQVLRVGTESWSCQQPLSSWAVEAVISAEQQGLSPVFVSMDGECRAVLSVGDPPRPGAARTLTFVLEAGHRLALLSGDRQSVVDHLVSRLEKDAGRKLFDTALGETTPESKLLWVELEKAKSSLFMVGDGVNDAGALAAATVGIAVHGGAEASVQAADVFATRPGIEPIADLLAGARRARQVILVNLAFSIAYNTVAVALTLDGRVSPLLAAVLMPLSSLTVVLHSYRRRMFRSAA